jgi:hypothetical protein
MPDLTDTEYSPAKNVRGEAIDITKRSPKTSENFAHFTSNPRPAISPRTPRDNTTRSAKIKENYWTSVSSTRLMPELKRISRPLTGSSRK